MKIGAENKKQLVIMAGLLIVAALVLIHTFSSVSGSAAPPPPEAPARAAAGDDTISDAGHKKIIPKVREKTLDPSLRLDILAATQKIEYGGGSDRNIFRMEEPKVPIPTAVASVKTAPVPWTPPAAPPPPPIPLKYYGFSNRVGEGRKAFLQDGDNIFVAVEGDVVERRYKIVKITNNSVLVEDVLNNNQQNVPLTPPQPAG